MHQQQIDNNQWLVSKHADSSQAYKYLQARMIYRYTCLSIPVGLLFRQHNLFDCIVFVYLFRCFFHSNPLFILTLCLFLCYVLPSRPSRSFIPTSMTDQTITGQSHFNWYRVSLLQWTVWQKWEKKVKLSIGTDRVSVLMTVALSCLYATVPQSSCSAR